MIDSMESSASIWSMRIFADSAISAIVASDASNEISSGLGAPAAAVGELKDYDWASSDAREAYRRIQDLMGAEVLDARFAGMKQALENATDADRARRIRANARSLGVPGVEVVLGAAPEVLVELPAPDAVFVGGGATAETLERSWSALRPGGRLVVHAVTLETEMIMEAAWREHGGELTLIAVEQLERIGGYHGWKPARAIVQLSVTKGAA